ncbi:MAG: glycosyltransferase [Ammonifex sp.]|nr:MAG: glycosyltransferase [Ammonifex sp.]
MISLCMVVKNEERSLGRCLRSVEGCVDEIVVVDTGSDDNTINVAKQFGAKVFYRSWDDDFAAARNFSISKATGDWIFYLDADEELEPDCSGRFRALADDLDVDGYLFQISNLTDSHDSIRHINLRLFRNLPGYRFEGRLHEQILDVIMRENSGKARILNSGINIFHYGYLLSEFTAKNKAERNFRINKLMVEEEPDNPFYLYSLGNSLVNRNDIENAAANYRKALTHLSTKENYAPSVFIALIACLTRLGRLAEALEQVEKCKSLYPDYVDIHFVEGEIYAKLGHLTRSELCFKECLRLGEQVQGKYTTRTGVGTFLPLFGLAQIYRTRGDLNRAIYCQIQGLKIKNDNIQDFIVLARLLKESFQDGNRVLEVLSKAIVNHDKAKETLILARLLYEVEEHDLALSVLDESCAHADDAHYLQGLALMKKGLYGDAIKSLECVQNDAAVYQAALQELVLAHWLSAPPRDAGPLIEKIEDQELGRVLQIVNEFLAGHPAANPPLENGCLREIVERLLTLKQAGTVLNILTVCGLESPLQKIDYLINAPLNNHRLELAAKLALVELKKGANLADFYFVLAWYFFTNDELDTAQNMLHHALTGGPQTIHYRELLREIYRKQTLNILLAALEMYPDNPGFNKQLIDLRKDALKHNRLEGVH